MADSYELVGQAKLIMWGHGCLASHVTRVSFTPEGHAVQLSIEVKGPVENWTHRQAVISCEDLAEFFKAVDGVREQPDSGEHVSRTGIGNIDIKAELQGGGFSYREAIDLRKLRQSGDLSLDLLRAAGAPVTSSLHPLALSDSASTGR